MNIHNVLAYTIVVLSDYDNNKHVLPSSRKYNFHKFTLGLMVIDCELTQEACHILLLTLQTDNMKACTW